MFPTVTVWGNASTSTEPPSHKNIAPPTESRGGLIEIKQHKYCKPKQNQKPVK